MRKALRLERLGRFRIKTANQYHEQKKLFVIPKPYRLDQMCWTYVGPTLSRMMDERKHHVLFAMAPRT